MSEVTERWLNVGCGPHLAPEPWVNTDKEPISPDVDTLDIRSHHLPAEFFDRIYLGHVLEHLYWDEVRLAIDNTIDLLAPGGQAMIVGPDCDRALGLLLGGGLTITQYQKLLESDVSHEEAGGDARHKWNCAEHRVTKLLRKTIQDFPEDYPYEVSYASTRLRDVHPSWPLVSAVTWQFALTITKKAPA